MTARLILGLLVSIAAPAALAAFDTQDRLDCHVRLEEAKWSDRVWPAGTEKPPRESVVSDEQLAQRVDELVRMEQALQVEFGGRIDAAALQGEIDRMTRTSRAPEQLQRWFAALKNDPTLIGECLARPNLVEQALRQAHASRYPNQDFSAWWAARKVAYAPAQPDSTHALSLPAILTHSVKAFSPEQWRAEPTPSERSRHSAVWTGTELIIWGGNLAAPGWESTNTGARYNPATDTWSTLSMTGAPEPRADAIAAWTGSEMLIFGGLGTSDTNGLATGGRYNPITDAWTSLSPAPTARRAASSAWTGSELIVWGGLVSNAASDTGERYNPTSNTWTPMTTTGAPAARLLAKGVWTGDRFLVWGGDGFADGGLYDPVGDAWSAVTATGAPTGGIASTAVWIGDSLLVFGGFTGNPPARYNPGTNSWTATPGLPIAGQLAFSRAVWTGSEAVAFGGYLDGSPTDAAISYDPTGNAWSVLTGLGAPTARADHTVSLAGARVVVWGGINELTESLRSGARYDLGLDSWAATADQGQIPEAAFDHAAVWTGTDMIVLGGSDAMGQPVRSRYQPATDSWTPINPTGAPANGEGASTTWTGTHIIVWGGLIGGSEASTGSRYNPGTDTWSAVTTTGAPSARRDHSATWTGTQLLIVGGRDGASTLATAARYNPGSNTWSAMASTPQSRGGHAAIWLGDRLFLWGGTTSGPALLGGAEYDPVDNAWTAIANPAGLLSAAGNYRLFDTGDEVLVVGKEAGNNLPRAARYTYPEEAWYPITVAGAPIARDNSSAIWTGAELVLWGGFDLNSFQDENTGSRYDPIAGTWTPTTTVGAPVGRRNHTAVWSGTDMIVWGGRDSFGSPPFGGVAFYEAPQAGATPSTTTITAPTPASVTVGQTYAVTVSVTGTAPTGAILVEDGAGQECRIALPATSCNLTASTAGPLQLRARYGGDVTHAPSRDTAAITVNKAQPTLDITGFDPPAGQVPTIAYGVTVSLTGPAVITGTVTVDDGEGASCTFNAATDDGCDLVSTVEGTLQITASYPGDALNEGASDSQTYTIAKTTPTLVINTITPAAGQFVGLEYSVSISINSASILSAPVTVDDGDGNSCQIDLSMSNFCRLASTSEGSKTITATYPGDPRNASTSDTTTYTINRASTTTFFFGGGDPGVSRVGEATTFRVRVSSVEPPDSGTVTMTATTGESCIASSPVPVSTSASEFTCQITFNSLGVRDIGASYSGSAAFLPSATSPPGIFHSVARVADLELVTTTTNTTLSPGAAIDFQIAIANLGPDDAPNTSVEWAFNQVIASPAWACTPANDPRCAPASGGSTTETLVSIPAGEAVLIELQGTVGAGATGVLTLDATLTPSFLGPDFVSDLNNANNADSMSVSLGDAVFGDGFESP